VLKFVDIEDVRKEEEPAVTIGDVRLLADTSVFGLFVSPVELAPSNKQTREKRADSESAKRTMEAIFG